MLKDLLLDNKFEKVRKKFEQKMKFWTLLVALVKYLFLKVLEILSKFIMMVECFFLCTLKCRKDLLLHFLLLRFKSRSHKGLFKYLAITLGGGGSSEGPNMITVT